MLTATELVFRDYYLFGKDCDLYAASLSLGAS